MIGWNVLLAATFASSFSQAATLPVRVVLEWPAGAPASARASAHIQAVRTAGSTDNGVPINAEAGPDETVLNLSEGVWKVRAFASGYWSQGTEITIAREAPVGVRLTFWPAASLHGEIVTASGEVLPDILEVQLDAVSTSVGETPGATMRPGPGPSHAELHCQIKAGTWSCLAPIGLFDMRLEAAGYTPRYEWGVNVKADASADLGRTELRRTASIFGRAVRKNSSDPPGPCRASLLTDMQRRSPMETDPAPDPESGPDGKTSPSVPLSRRGYFQLIGMAPGRYGLAVECQEASGFRDIHVEADGETRVDPPVHLEELALDMTVTPKLDPSGQPWKVAVYATSPHYLLIADGAKTSAEGRWIRHGLIAGNYHVIVRGSDGTSWLEKYFDLRQGSGPLLLHVASVSVAGRVTLSSRPVRARLVFSNNEGGESATLYSGADGRFQGLLPVAHGTRESSWTVEAHVLQPPVSRNLLNVSVQPAGGGASTWLDLELPAIAVHGSVVSQDGKPQPGIQVIFEDASGARTTTGTDANGRFEMPDLPPGKYIAVADSFDGVSERTSFNVTEAGGRELKLVLNRFKRFPFQVVSSQGPVADAAVQVWITPGVPRAFKRTDQEGHFDVTLPPGTTEVGLTIGAPEYALKLTRVPISASDGPPDAHTITLDTTAATLVLDFQPPGHTPDSSAVFYLVHKGAIQDARTAVGWGTNQAGANDNGPAVVEAIEPGAYALCSITDQAQLAAIWGGGLPPSYCRSGSVEYGGSLTLSPP